jgi:uncharacterized protein with ParB-like and HNH nuclease domain
MPELNVSRKTISEILRDMQGKKFIIPEYQRPYNWDSERCTTLWRDLLEFFQEKKENEEYYLGTIVTYKSESNKKEIQVIDGQQRLTSLLLLLRAIYKKLELMGESQNVIGLMRQIEPCIWDIDPISTLVQDKSKIHIESKVATDEDNEVLHEILTNSITREDKKDNYTKNYKIFYSMCELYASQEPMKWESLCVAILKSTIILPIECENEETALRIFSTLNDRGMSLSDSDIFKAQIYKNKPTSESKTEFNEQWKDLTERTEEVSLKIDDLFRYYSHIIRGKENDRSKEIALRKFYSGTDNKFKKLHDPLIMVDLFNLSEFWSSVIQNRKETNIYNSDFTYKTFEYANAEIQKYLHCLSVYPNEYWKYIISVFYFKNMDTENFIERFNLFIKKVIAFLFQNFIINPTVNEIKSDIYGACIDIIHGRELNFSIEISESFDENFKNSQTTKIARAIILLKAYLDSDQKELIKEFEIEHIFPRKWQIANYSEWNRKDAEQYLERYGNKIAFEKKLNIQAGNGYFHTKKGHYSRSKISEVKKISLLSQPNWLKQDIERREVEFKDILYNFFQEHTTWVIQKSSTE